MNNETKVGVITPCYNAGKYIQKCIDSVFIQNHENVIHFIFNDGDSNPININNDRVIVVNSLYRTGQSHARNELITLAKKHKIDYIAFLDADDWWEPNHISESLKSLSRNSADIVYSKPLIVNEDNDLLNSYGIVTPKIFIGKQLEINNFIYISGVVAHIKCFNDNKFDSNLNGLEDWDMWIRLMRQKYVFTNDRGTTFTYLVKTDGEASRSIDKLNLFRDKHNAYETKTKLNIACGKDYQKDYINMDLYPEEGAVIDAIADAMNLPYEDDSVDEIRALHIIEHFHFHDISNVLKEWRRVLKPNGTLIIETPDLLETCNAFVNGSEDFRILLYGHFFAFPWIDGNTHKFLFTERQLITNLTWAGFKDFERIAPMSNYVRPDTYNLFLAMKSMKA